MKNINALRIGFVILSVLFLISLGFNIYYNKTDKKVTSDTTIVRTVRIDTVKDTIPQVKTEKVTYYATVTLPLHDTVTMHDSVTVSVPITQKTYSDDSTYTAYVSGYRPQLDSINVYQKYVTIDRTITNVKKDNKKFGIGPVLYGGYDIHNRQVGWGVGIGVTYTVIKF